MKWEKQWVTGATQSKQVLQLEQSELPAIQRAVKQSINKLQLRYNRLKDIHEAGEATERQCTQMFALEHELEELRNFLSYSK